MCRRLCYLIRGSSVEFKMDSTYKPPSLVRRCLQCPSIVPSCPACAPDERCLLQSVSCEACASARCVKTAALPGQPQRKNQTPAIAGGVSGAVLFVIIATFAIWWFCIRKRRQEWDEAEFSVRDNESVAVEKSDDGPNRASRYSVRSIASTVRTQNSNVIPIAYIPGVTNRSPTESPSMFVPPVPPVPMASAGSSPAPSPHEQQDRHFFMPSDVRDSTYSDTSRQSLSPSLARASVGTTLWRGHAEIRPTHQALRGKAAVVTLNKGGSGNNSPSDAKQQGLLKSPIVARNLTAKPIQVKKSNSVNKSKVPTLANLKAASGNKPALHSHAEGTPDPSEDEEADANTRLISPTKARHGSAGGTVIEDSPAVKQSQFTNVSSSGSSTSSFGFSPVAPSGPGQARQQPSPNPSQRSHHSSASWSHQPGQTLKHNKSGSLNSLIEEAMSRAARDPLHGLGSISETPSQATNPPTAQAPGANGQRVRGDSGSLSGPFSDAHEQEPPSRFSDWSPR